MYLENYGEFDAFVYECCKKYQANHPLTKLIFVTPYITPKYQKLHLQYLTSKYDEIICPPIEDKPQKFAISYRNKWMVEQADYVICGIQHEWRGAYQTYRHAKRKSKPIFNLIEKALS